MAASPSDPVSASPAEASRSNPTVRGHAVPQRHETAFNKARYVSIVQGIVALDDDWQSCAQRVRGVSGAKYKKVRSAEELAAFCAKYGVAPPTDA